MECDPTSLTNAAGRYCCLTNIQISAAGVYALCAWANARYADADANAFLDAAGITDPAQSLAVFELVRSLKNTGSPSFWSREELIYPMVGGTSQSCRVNLKNPGTNDLIETPGALPAYSANGIEGNGINAFLDTGFVPTAAMQDSIRAFMYLDKDATIDNSHYYGFSQNVPTPCWFLARHNVPSDIYYTVNDNVLWPTPFGAPLLGGFCYQRKINTHKEATRGSNALTSINVLSTGTDFNSPIHLLARNVGVPILFSDARLSGWSLGQPFVDDAEWQQYLAIWQTFQTALGRAQ